MINNLISFSKSNLVADSNRRPLSIVVEGYICKTGRLCGYIRKYGVRSRDNSDYISNEVNLNKLVYFGYHEALTGKSIGPIYKMLYGGSVLLSEQGKFSGHLKYIYQNANFALMGSFDEYSNLIEGQKVVMKKQECTNFGLKKIVYSEPTDPLVVYHYNPPNSTSFGDQPNVPDEIAVEYLMVRDSPNAKVCKFKILKMSTNLKVYRQIFLLGKWSIC